MSSIPTFHALLIDEIKDLYHAENQLLKALPKMAKSASNSELKAGLTAHVAQTRGHVTRLAQSLKLLGQPARGKPCHAMMGLVAEGTEAIKAKSPPAVRDAALIGAAQRVEHYEMAGYGTARAFAHALGESKVASLLQTTLDEEGESNKHLTRLSVTVNAEALSAGGDRSSARRSRKEFESRYPLHAGESRVRISKAG